MYMPKPLLGLWIMVYAEDVERKTLSAFWFPHNVATFLKMELKGLDQWVVGRYVLAFVSETHIGCDALREKYLWKHVKTIFGEKDIVAIQRDMEALGI